MRYIKFWLFLLSTILFACSKSDNKSAPSNDVAQFDLSGKEEMIVSYTANFDNLYDSKFDPATDVSALRVAALLNGIGESHFVESWEDCTDNNGVDEHQQSDRPYSPSAQMRLGQFLGNGTYQQLIGMSFGRCEQPYWYRDYYLKLFQGDREIASGKVDCLQRFFLIPHPKSENKHAILGFCSGSGQGYSESHAVIYEVQDEKITVLDDLGRVAGDNCGVHETGGLRYFMVYEFGKHTDYTIKVYRGPCEDIFAAEFLHAGPIIESDFDYPSPEESTVEGTLTNDEPENNLEEEP